MSEKKVILNVPMTYAGVNYDAGLAEMPEAAAKSAIRRKLGKYTGEDSSDTSGQEGNFTPLSFEETFKRFEDGDAAPEVFESLKFYQPKIAEAKKAGKSVGEFLKAEQANAGSGGGGQQKDGLPEDFPMRHVFEKLGTDFDSVEKIQKMSFEDLVKADGIGEATAKKALEYKK